MFKEGIECKIKLHGVNPALVDRMIHYFYNFDYYSSNTDYRGNNLGNDDHSHTARFSAPIHVQMYCVADKYDDPGLRMLALEKFKEVTAVSCQHWYVLVQATYAINKAQLEESDTPLHNLLVDAWLLSGCASWLMEYLTATFTKLMSDAPWLSIAIHYRTLKSLALSQNV